MIDLRCGDCLQIMKQIPDKSVDMILCDLPYGATDCKWDTVIPFDKLWEQYNRIIKEDGAIVLFGNEPFASKLRMSNLKMYRYDWIWNKITAVGMGYCKYQPMRSHEYICVFYKKSGKYFPIMTLKEKPHTRVKVYKTSDVCPTSTINNEFRLRTTNYPKSIITFSNANHHGLLHPTQKPVALCEYLIKTYTNENDTVLDNCMGSGTTGVACKRLNRNFIGIDIDENYCKIAENRIKGELL